MKLISDTVMEIQGIENRDTLTHQLINDMLFSVIYQFRLDKFHKMEVEDTALVQDEQATQYGSDPPEWLRELVAMAEKDRYAGASFPEK